MLPVDEFQPFENKYNMYIELEMLPDLKYRIQSRLTSAIIAMPTNNNINTNSNIILFMYF